MTPWVKRLSIALSISVALNLLAVGFALGRRAHRPSKDIGETHVGPPGGHKRGLWRNAFEPHRAELRGQQDALKKARQAAREALVAPTFERQKLDQALSNLRSETAKGQELLHRALGDAAVRAEPAARRDLARSLERFDR